MKKTLLRMFSRLIIILPSHTESPYKNQNEYGELSFLNCSIERNLIDDVNQTIQGKPTHSNRYTVFNSVQKSL